MTAPLIFGIFLRGVRKIGYFCGGRQGYCVSTFDLFSFLLELIRHSDLAFQTQRKGTLVYGFKFEASLTSSKYKIFLVMKFLLKVPEHGLSGS